MFLKIEGADMRLRFSKNKNKKEREEKG